MTRIDFDRVNWSLSRFCPGSILKRWAPGGRRQGREYVALNPRRADRHLGSFRVNLATGKWSDFATDDRGGDVVSLAAYLFDIPQAEAARRVAAMLGLPE